MSTPAEARSTTVQTLFVVTFFSLLAILNLIVGLFWLDGLTPVRLAQFIILQAINVGVAYSLAELLLSAVAPARDLPRLAELERTPRVALLYTTCDDVVVEALSCLDHQIYPECDVFILDDSRRPEHQRRLDASGARIVRRRTRQGFKAGNLNNWLAAYGVDYEYFVVIDSDSILQPEFVAEMLRYAEHAANRRIAVFQSRVRVWNLGSRLARMLDAWYPLWYHSAKKLANRIDTAFCWGHNCLYRTHAVQECGGFTEDFVAEDYATCLRLMQRGHQCKFVDVVSYEAAPSSLRAYSMRSARWARQTLQLLGADMTGISFTARLHIFMNAYSFAIWLLYIPGMLLAVWSHQSTLEETTTLVRTIAGGAWLDTPLRQPILVIACYNAYFLLARLPLALRLGMPLKAYFGTLLLNLALGPYVMIPLILAQASYLLGARSVSFHVTEKHGGSTSFARLLYEMRYGLLVLFVLALGLARNPAALVFNWPWAVPFLCAPFILYLVQRGPTSTGRASPAIANIREVTS